MSGTSSLHSARPMTGITIRVLDGADRGRVFANLSPPITIGREEGNTIQLNDERVSRFHVKIQEDHNRLVITDLESTNGSKVNGTNVKGATHRRKRVGFSETARTVADWPGLISLVACVAGVAV